MGTLPARPGLPGHRARRILCRIPWPYEVQMTAGDIPAFPYDDILRLIRHRRSVRRFEKGKTVSRDELLKIAEAGRWGPTGANAQPWDLVIVDDPVKKQQVLDVFLRQSQRLVDHAKGFPAVKKTYLANTVAIFIVLGDPRWKACFPQATTAEWEHEYAENNERIYLASLGAVIQNIQLAVTACGLTSAWLSGGGEATTNRELSDVLGYPSYMEAIGTIPIGYPEKDVNLRYRRPLGQIVHWNGYDPDKIRPDDMVEYYVSDVRPYAMYRSLEDMNDWQDADEILGRWKLAFTGAGAKPSP
jgi:nitroreductase